MSLELHRLLERTAIAAMLLGIVGMFQPWIFDLFGWGFLLLLFATLAFTVISNITPSHVEKPELAESGAEIKV